MIDWGPDSFAAVGGALVAVGVIGFAAYEVREWRRRKQAERDQGPEQHFREMIENFNRLDQSVTADSIETMPSGRRRG